MMEEMYGLHQTAGYSEQPSVVPPDNHSFPVGYRAAALAVANTRDRFPIFGSEQFFSVPTAVSEAASVQRFGSGEELSSAIRAKVASHPLYPKLVEAYIHCQKVGAPQEIANQLDKILRENEFSVTTAVSTYFGADPELDEFMETYCYVLAKYKSDLSRPFNEATTFLNSIEMQLNNLCKAPCRSQNSGLSLPLSSLSNSLLDEGAGSSEDGFSGGEMEVQDFHRIAEDRELKDKLFRKYSGYISSLKHEFSKKKKKGKLPKEARQTLLDWWNMHYKWPYPTEADKVALAVSTGLDQKQINNWFINQRKRHWKPSENMQFAVMDSIYGPFYVG